MLADEVLRVYDNLKKAGVIFWIEGGWAIDALVSGKDPNHQPRLHTDLDLVVKDSDSTKSIICLQELGYSESPSKFENKAKMSMGANKTELHFVSFDRLDTASRVIEKGKPAFVYPSGSFNDWTGVIRDKQVSCVSPNGLAARHYGYDRHRPDDFKKDLRDMKLLARHFDTELKQPYTD